MTFDVSFGFGDIVAKETFTGYRPQVAESGVLLLIPCDDKGKPLEDDRNLVIFNADVWKVVQGVKV